MNLKLKKASCVATMLVLLSATFSGCCSSGSGCGMFGLGAVEQNVVVPSSCSTCSSSPVISDHYQAGISEVTEAAPTYVAHNTEYAPSWTSSSAGSSAKSCGST